MRATPGTTVRMSLSPERAAKGRAGVLLWPGRRSHSKAADSRSAIRGLGLREELGLPGVCQKTESPHAECVTKEKSLFVRITSSELFLHPLVRELEDLHLRYYGEYCKSCRGQWHRGGAEWHERAIESPLPFEKVRDSPQAGLQPTTRVSVFAPEAANKAMACAISVGNA